VDARQLEQDQAGKRGNRARQHGQYTAHDTDDDGNGTGDYEKNVAHVSVIIGVSGGKMQGVAGETSKAVKALLASPVKKLLS
jgi:hypothetical protein